MYQTVFLRTSLLVFIISMVSCKQRETSNTLPYYNEPNFTPLFINNTDSANFLVTHHIGDFSFIDQNNRNITQKDIEGKIHVANFIFTSCGSICPVLTKHMKLVAQQFAQKDVVLLSYSVTPWIDDVKRLKDYAYRNAIKEKNWHFLTGNKSEIYNLARKSYFAEEDLGFTKDSTDFLHTEHILLVDKHKKIRGIYNGTLQLEAEQLIEDIKILQKENSAFN